jgi:O-acetyl-ADP-ribose deacetylase (regulator of RNase III)
MPKIGAGLAGGDWDTIAGIIEEELTSVLPVVYVLD